jgi:putative heme-binding domain-containing protein
LYVADFYNRIIAHVEVPLDHPGRDRHRGRIWRISYGNGGRRPGRQPNRSRAATDELLRDLAHPNLAVRMIATHELADRIGVAAVEPLRRLLADAASHPYQRMHGVWVLKRLDALDGSSLAKALGDRDPGVRLHAMRTLVETAEWTADQQRAALAGLEESDAFVRRTAAEALGRHADSSHLRPLLLARAGAPEDDTHLVHVLRMALRDQLRAPDVLANTVREAWSADERRLLADAMLGVDHRLAALFLLDHLSRTPGEKNMSAMVTQAARVLPPVEHAAIVRFAESHPPGDLDAQVSLWQAYRNGIGTAMPQGPARLWAERVMRRVLESNDRRHAEAAYAIAGLLRWRPAEPLLSKAMASTEASVPARVAAAEALISIDASRFLPDVGAVLRDGSAPDLLRRRIIAVVARAPEEQAQAELLQVLPTAHRRIQIPVAQALLSAKRGARLLLSAIAEGKAPRALLLERGIAARLDSAEDPAIAQLYRELSQGVELSETDVQRVIDERRKGYERGKASAARGSKVFESTCARCHQIRGQGKKIGPQLDGIGARGIDRLLEDILDPNRNVDPAFATMIVTLSNGGTIMGQHLRDEGDTLVFADDAGDEVRVARSRIRERRTSRASPMPSDFAGRIAAHEFNDLMTFLLEQ